MLAPRMLGVIVAFLFLLLVPAMSSIVTAPVSAAPSINIITAVSGHAVVIRSLTGESSPAGVGDALENGDRVVTGAAGGALITFPGGATQELDAMSEVRVHGWHSSPDGGSVLILGHSTGVATSTLPLLDAKTIYQLQTPTLIVLSHGGTVRARVAVDRITGRVLEEAIAFSQGSGQAFFLGEFIDLAPGTLLRLLAANPSDPTSVPVVLMQPGSILTFAESSFSGGAYDVGGTVLPPDFPAATTAPSAGASNDRSGGGSNPTPTPTPTPSPTPTTGPANSDPVAVGDSALVTFNEPRAIDVLANDFDADGDAISVSGNQSISRQGGNVNCAAAGRCVYTPPLDFVGSDRFMYSIIDGHGGRDRASVSLEVAPASQLPVYGG